MYSKGDTKPCMWIGMPTSSRCADTSTSIPFGQAWSSCRCDGPGQATGRMLALFQLLPGWRREMFMPSCRETFLKMARNMSRLVDAMPTGSRRVVACGCGRARFARGNTLATMRSSSASKGLLTSGATRDESLGIGVWHCLESRPASSSLATDLRDSRRCQTPPVAQRSRPSQAMYSLTRFSQASCRPDTGRSSTLRWRAWAAASSRDVAGDSSFLPTSPSQPA